MLNAFLAEYVGLPGHVLASEGQKVIQRPVVVLVSDEQMRRQYRHLRLHELLKTACITIRWNHDLLIIALAERLKLLLRCGVARLAKLESQTLVALFVAVEARFFAVEPTLSHVHFIHVFDAAHIEKGLKSA